MKNPRVLKTRQVLILQAVVIVFASTLVTAAYNFRNQDQISGPAIGETIDLRLFHSQKAAPSLKRSRDTRSR